MTTKQASDLSSWHADQFMEYLSFERGMSSATLLAYRREIVRMMDFVLLTPKKLKKLVYVYQLVVRRLLFVKNITKNGKKKLKMIDL